MAEDGTTTFITPVANPLFFEDPQILSELRPLFVYHSIPKSFLTQGGDVRVYAAQIRYALTDRLAIIATKDGFIEFNPKAVLPHQDGWADLAAGLKYAIIKDDANKVLVTPGFKIELPTGNERVFQGAGKGEWDLFVSAAKGWDKAEVVGNVGFRIPNDFDAKTAQAHYSLQLGYNVCRWFRPMIFGNGFTVLSEGKGLAIGVEGFDLINFGTSNADGYTAVTIGGGFRSNVYKNVDLGFAGEYLVTTPKGLFENRFTMDVAIRF